MERANNARLFQQICEHQLRSDAKLMRSIIGLLIEGGSLVNSGKLKDAWLRRDRGTVLHMTRPLYKKLRAKYDITHFYFTDSDRTNFLRVHRPDRHGDKINRFTTMLSTGLHHYLSLPPQTQTKTSMGEPYYLTLFVPLLEASGRKVGIMAVLRDKTMALATGRKLATWIVSVSLIMGAGLWWLFYGILGRVERNINLTRQNLARETNKRATLQALHIAKIEEDKKKLSDSEGRFATTFSSIDNGIITTDMEGRVVLMNRVAQSLTGWRQTESEGRL